jgi:hypothetical protein
LNSFDRSQYPEVIHRSTLFDTPTVANRLCPKFSKLSGSMNSQPSGSVTRSTAYSAGMMRRARRSKKVRNENRPARISATMIEAMRYPLMTKKTSTPT